MITRFNLRLVSAPIVVTCLMFIAIAIFRGKIYLDMFIALANHCMEDKILV